MKFPQFPTCCRFELICKTCKNFRKFVDLDDSFLQHILQGLFTI